MNLLLKNLVTLEILPVLSSANFTPSQKFLVILIAKVVNLARNGDRRLLAALFAYYIHVKSQART